MTVSRAEKTKHTSAFSPRPDRGTAGSGVAAPSGGERPARDRLLDAAVEYVAANGIGDVSLRRLAEALGTSHRMLIYHFGSREGLLVEVVRAVEERQREALAELEERPGATPEEVGQQMWERLADESLWPLERLFFELYGQALQGRPHAAPLLDGIVENWLGPGTELAIRHGIAPEDAPADARLGLAVVRGLLLDLLATQDREGVDAAMARYLELWRGGS
jgi:AcrR family transcriptional regulator